MSGEPCPLSDELQGEAMDRAAGAEARGGGGAGGRGGGGGGGGGRTSQGGAARDGASKAKKVENVSHMVTLAEKTRQKEAAKRRLLQAELARCTFAPAISSR